MRRKKRTKKRLNEEGKKEGREGERENRGVRRRRGSSWAPWPWEGRSRTGRRRAKGKGSGQGLALRAKVKEWGHGGHRGGAKGQEGKGESQGVKRRDREQRARNAERTEKRQCREGKDNGWWREIKNEEKRIKRDSLKWGKARGNDQERGKNKQEGKYLITVAIHNIMGLHIVKNMKEKTEMRKTDNKDEWKQKKIRNGCTYSPTCMYTKCGKELENKWIRREEFKLKILNQRMNDQIREREMRMIA